MKKIFLLLFLFLMGIVGVNAVLDDAVLYYSLDNDNLSSSNPLDISGNGNDGTNVGATTGLNGILNQAFLFNAKNEKINANKQLIPTNGDFTANIWVKINSGTDNAPLINQYTSSVTNRFIWRILPDSNLINVDWNGGGSISSIYGKGNNWAMATIVRNGSSLKLYLDGSQVGSSTSSSNIEASNTIIGDPNFANNPNYYLDEASIYNRALSLSEIQELYNSGDGYNPYSFTQSITFDSISLIDNGYYSTDDLNVSVAITYNDPSNVDQSFNLDFNEFTNVNMNEYGTDIGVGGIGGDINTYSYSSKTLSLSSQDSSMVGLIFTPDGNTLYTSGATNNAIYQYNCNQKFELNSCTYSGISYTSSLDTPYDIEFNNDGTKMYVLNLGNDRVRQFSCSTPYTLNSCSLLGTSLSFPSSWVPTAIKFNNDGTNLFVLDFDTTTYIYRFSCSTPYDVSTCSYNANLLQTINRGYSFDFNHDYTKIYYIDIITDRAYQYDCGDINDLNSCTINNNFLSLTNTQTQMGLYVNNLEGVLISMDDTNDLAYQYNTNSFTYFSTGSLEYSFIATKDYDTITLSDVRTLNGGTIASKIIHNSIEYPITNTLNLDIGINDEVTLVYEFTTDTTQTPLLTDVVLSMSNSVEIVPIDVCYVLNGASCIQFINQAGSGVAQLINLPEGENTIYFTATRPNDITQDSGTYTFTIDTTNPTLSVNLPSEINSYNINFSQYINYSDNIGVLSCIVLISGETQTNCNETSYNFSTSGNKTINVTLTDLAGNSVSDNNNLLLVNPSLNITLYNSLTSQIVSDYTLGDITTTGNTTTFNVYDFGLGNTTLLFFKTGYNQKNITLTLTNSTNTNFNFTVEPVTLYAKAFDFKTKTPLTFDVIIENSTNVSTFTGITELNKMYYEIPTGDIKMTFSSSGYSNGLFYNTLTSFTSLNFSVYLFPDNVSNVMTFTITDFDTRQFLEGVTIEARTVINNSEVTIQQTKTTASGIAYLLLDPTLDYSFYFSKDDYTQAIIDSIPGVTSYNIRLKKDVLNFEFVNGVNIRYFTQNEVLYRNTTYNFIAQVQGSSITSVTYTLYDNLNNTLYTRTGTNPTGESFEYSYFLPLSSNATKLYQKTSYIVNGNTFEQVKEYKVYTLSSSDIENILNFGNATDEESQLIKFFIILITYVITILIGMNFQITQNYVSALTLLPTILFTYFGWIPFLYGTVIAIATIALYIGGNKRL